jgi:magnesium-protoporphyrin O-methyltransferase
VELGVADRVQRRVVDLAATPEAVEPADLVVLHRVVCCYPDYDRLLGASADRCTSRLAFSHPPRNVGSRAVAATQNALSAMRGRDFRTFAHPPQAMVAVVESRGLRQAYAHRGGLWRVEGLAR